MRTLGEIITALDNDGEVTEDEALMVVQVLIHNEHDVTLPLDRLRKRLRDVKEGLFVESPCYDAEEEDDDDR